MGRRGLNKGLKAGGGGKIGASGRIGRGGSTGCMRGGAF